MNGKQRRYLRSLGHSLRPLVQVGKAKITDNVIVQVTDNLTAHELIKIKLLGVSGPERKELGEELAKSSKSELIQVLGGTVLLYKKHPDKPKIELPV